MNQIPANSNDATTGHKLQGMSKDVIIVLLWPTGGLSLMFKNWDNVVLSRVRTLSGLYLVEPIDMDNSLTHLFNSDSTWREPCKKKGKYLKNAE